VKTCGIFPQHSRLASLGLLPHTTGIKAAVLLQGIVFGSVFKTNTRNMNKEERERRETPIIDGDARPDMPVDAEDKKNKKDREKTDKDKKFETERLSDINTLEDYKDAKSK
jgi:hypothetical protein